MNKKFSDTDKLGDTQSYKRNKVLIKEIRERELAHLSDNDIAKSLLELTKIYRLVERKGLNLRYANQGNSTKRSSMNGNNREESREGGRNTDSISKTRLLENLVLSNSVNNTIWGTPIMGKEDFESLLNHGITVTINRLKRDRQAEELIREIVHLADKNDVNYKYDSFFKNTKNPTINLGPKENQGDLLSFCHAKDMGRIKELVGLLKDLGIQSVKKYKTVNNIYGYLHSFFTSKIINESVSLEFRREMNRERKNKTQIEIVDSDLESRRDFLNIHLENNLTKADFETEENPKIALYSQIKLKRQEGATTEEIFDVVRDFANSIGLDTSNFEPAKAIKLVEKYLKNTFDKNEDNETVLTMVA